MNKPAATLVWCAAAAIGLAAPHIRAAGGQERATPGPITVVVNNFAEVSTAVLERAEMEASQTYHRMGVRTIWLDAALGPTVPTADSGFTIRLIIQPQLAGASGSGSRTVLGAAPPSQSEREGSIYVYYDRVADVAAGHHANTAMLMGIVIGHEMAHHLLHHADHADQGLMRGVWDDDTIQRGAMGLLWFSPSELQEIRKTLSTCCAALPTPVK